MIPAETFYVDNITDSVWGFPVGPGRIAVHTKDRCKAPCPIHHPSNHHMRDWPTTWRGDRKLLERVCPHGIGHPDPDDKSPDKTHGCDRCCIQKETIQ